MVGDLFDSPWKILIVAVVLIVLFGSAKLPVAARSLGKSMRILKTEVQGLHEEEDTKRNSATPTLAPTGTQQTITSQQHGPATENGPAAPASGTTGPVGI